MNRSKNLDFMAIKNLKETWNNVFGSTLFQSRQPEIVFFTLQFNAAVSTNKKYHFETRGYGKL